jgi:hypothetical protein
MKKVQVRDKYPVYVEEIAKSQTSCAGADDVVARLRGAVEAAPAASLIAVFDHQAHVAAQPDAQINPAIKDSKHVLFCLANTIPNPLIPAVRPRAVSIVELEEKFVISFLEAPMEKPNQVISGWIEALRDQ